MENLTFKLAKEFHFEISQDDIPFFSESNITHAEPITLVFLLDEEEIGFVKFEIKAINKNAYITYYVKKQHRGKGLGLVMLKNALKFGFEELNLNRVTAEVYEYNTASNNVLLKLGFKEEGRLRKAKFHKSRFWDIIIYGLLKEEFKNFEV